MFGSCGSFPSSGTLEGNAETPSVFLLLNKGRGHQNVSQRSAKHHGEKSRVSGQFTAMVNVRLRQILPLKQWQKVLPQTKQKLEIPIEGIHSQMSQKDPLIFACWTIFEHTTYQKQLRSKCDDYMGNVFTARTFSPRFRFSSEILHRCLKNATSETARGLQDRHTLPDSTCRLKMPLTSPARCTGDHSPSKRNKCRMSYAMYSIFPWQQTS